MRMCRPGGVIVWHDWANFGEYHDVMRAVLDLAPASRWSSSHPPSLLRIAFHRDHHHR